MCIRANIYTCANVHAIYVLACWPVCRFGPKGDVYPVSLNIVRKHCCIEFGTTTHILVWHAHVETRISHLDTRHKCDLAIHILHWALLSFLLELLHPISLQDALLGRLLTPSRPIACRWVGTVKCTTTARRSKKANASIFAFTIASSLVERLVPHWSRPRVSSRRAWYERYDVLLSDHVVSLVWQRRRSWLSRARRRPGFVASTRLVWSNYAIVVPVPKNRVSAYLCMYMYESPTSAFMVTWMYAYMTGAFVCRFLHPDAKLTGTTHTHTRTHARTRTTWRGLCTYIYIHPQSTVIAEYQRALRKAGGGGGGGGGGGIGLVCAYALAHVLTCRCT